MGLISVLIGVLIIVVVGAICFWAIDKFANDRGRTVASGQALISTALTTQRQSKPPASWSANSPSSCGMTSGW
jgi:predicted lipid-binding transport protein (Tim44 family)